MSFQSSRKSIAAISLLALCIVPIALALYVQQRHIFDPLPIGQKVPSFAATSLDGDAFVLDRVAGRKLLLLLFAAGCNHCRMEIGNLEELRVKYENRIDIVGISLDDSNATDALRRELNVRFPILLDDNKILRRMLRPGFVPAIYCIDEFQILRHYVAGEHSLAFDDRLIEEFVSTPFTH